MIINFGSINIDMIMHVNKLPTPGDTILCNSYSMLPGGKGANQAVAAAGAGSRVIMFGQVGSDEFGQIAINSMKQKGINTDYIAIDSIPTGCASISVDSHGENIITVASGANNAVKSSIIPDSLLTETTTVLMQMEVNPKQNWDLLKRAKKNKCLTILNLAPAMKMTQEALKNLSYLIMNEVEARHLGKDLKVPVSNLNTLAEFLAKRFELTAIITRGSKGAIAYTEKGEGWGIAALPVKAIDTTGAGDAFVGILAAMLDQGKGIKKALQYAIIGSGLGCLKQGAQSSFTTIKEIEANLNQAPEPIPLYG